MTQEWRSDRVQMLKKQMPAHIYSRATGMLKRWNRCCCADGLHRGSQREDELGELMKSSRVALIAERHQQSAATHMLAKCQKWGSVVQRRRPRTANKPSSQDRQIRTQVRVGVCPGSLIRGPSWADWHLIQALEENPERWAGHCGSGSPHVSF